MIVSIIILALFAVTLLFGWKHGLIRTITRFAGQIIVWAVAVLMAHRLGMMLKALVGTDLAAQWSTPVPKLVIDSASDFLYSGIAFALIMVVGSIIIWFVQRGLAFINKIPFLGFFNRLAGLLFGAAVAYIEVFFILNIIRTWDLAWLQDQLTNSPIAQFILLQTPILSDHIYQWFLLI
ncbi:MAG: CvpA family protein [Lactobacillaceae bacterium]|jgi:uncharacterized membrane protein required for colicin V production|nr:CvpA family protein [Lactobacillaceae bacterium]